MSTSSIVLYGFPLSGNAHRAELALTLLGLAHEYRTVNLPGGEQKTPDFLAMNPEGKVPVLVDGDTVVYDSTAILTYLAAKYDAEHRWIPADPKGQAEVHRFFAQASGPLAAGPARARLIELFNAPFDRDATATAAHAYLKQLEGELDGRDYLVGGAATFADVAIYSYVARAPEGHVALDGYPNIRAWLARVEGLTGFAPMPWAKEFLAA